MRDITINLQKANIWKTQLTSEINFFSLKYAGEERVMHSKSDDIKLMLYDNANEVVDKLFESLL